MRGFSFGVFVDVLCFQGTTWLAFVEYIGGVSRGLVIYRWNGVASPAEEIFRDDSVTTHGFPRFGVSLGAPFCIYRRDEPDESVIGVNLATMQMAPWAVRCAGNDPCCADAIGQIAVNTWDGASFRVLASRWPAVPDTFARVGAGTGLSRFDKAAVVLVDEDRFYPRVDPIMLRPCFASHLVVGEGPDEGVIAEIDPTIGKFWPGQQRFTPRCSQQNDGTYTIAAWGPGLPVEVLEQVTVADLNPEEPPMPELPSESQQRALVEALKFYRRMFPATITGEQCGWILNSACWDRKLDGWRLSAKSGEVKTPAGVEVSYDAFHHISDTIWDFATAEFHTMRILDMPILQPHHNNPNRPPVAAVPPGPPPDIEDPDPPDPPDPPNPVFDKEKAKEESIAAAAAFIAPVLGIPVEEAAQGCREMWDKFPADYLPSVMELVAGALMRTPPSAPIPDEDINAHIDEAIEETERLRAKAGYVCGPPTTPPPVVTPPVRVRAVGTTFQTVTSKPWQWRSVTGFDLPFQIGKRGDPRFADWAMQQRFSAMRIVPATVYRNPRTLAEGIAWLRPTLDALTQRGLYAEVTILVDTADNNGQYGLTADQMRAYVREIGGICEDYPNTLVELANEPGHAQNQAAILTVPQFLEELRGLIGPFVPVSWGSHGGDQSQIDQGDFITIHEDRGQTPEQNAAFWAPYQTARNRPLVRDEPLGVAEVAIPGKRTNDPQFGLRLAKSTREHGIAGATLHLEAGLYADYDKLGDIQREAARLFIQEMTR